MFFSWLDDKMNLSLFTKPFCRFLIHRYMGQYLKTEITTDQLELKLQDGIASVQNVSLNVEYIDELVKPFGVVRVLQGYVDEISVTVPWTKLMSESTIIRVRGLELTLSPLQSLDNFNAQELASSMFGSTTSNMELARSFISNEDEMSIDDPENGIAQLASLLDQVINRIKIIFEKTTVRLETENDLATGLEFQIDRMEFVDEKLDACEQNQGDVPITSQPTSFSAVTELNKLLHIQGVRIYTDIWSNYRDSSSMASSQDLGGLNESVAKVVDQSMVSSNFQSCYSQFPEKKTSIASSQPSTHSTDSSNSNSIPTNPILIAQLFGDRSTLRIRVYNTALSTRADAAFNKKVEIDIQLVGNAFLFMTPTQLALIQELLAMLAPSTKSKSKTEGGPFGGLAGGQPMRSEHYAHVSDTVAAQVVSGSGDFDRLMMGGRDTMSVPHSNAISSGGMSPAFYELQRGTPQRRSASVAHTSQKFTTISLQDDPGDHHHQRHGSGSSAMYGGGASQADSDSLTDRGTQHGSNLTLTERRPDLIEFTVRAPGLVFLLSHDDPLSSDQIYTTQSGDPLSASNVNTIKAQILKLADMSAQFFKRAANIKLTSWKAAGADALTVLQQQRQALISLYPQDHLKVICRQAYFQFHNECDSQRSIFDLKCKLHECDISEFLTAESIHQPLKESKEAAHFDILNFCDEAKAESGQQRSSLPHLQFLMKNFHEREQHRRVEFQLAPCQSHVDLSILDRLSNLLVQRPFYKAVSSTAPSITGSSTPARDENPLSGLREIQFDDTQPEAPETYDFSFSCARWLLDLQVPRADYTPTAPTYTIKSLHDEFLRLQVEDACLSLGRFQLADLQQHAELDLKCQSISGEFVGDSALLASKEHRFFHASAASNTNSTDRMVRISIKYDNRNKQLQQQIRSDHTINYLSNAMTDSFHPSLQPDMARSMYESFYPKTDEDEADGPFTHARNYQGDERLISPGTHQELENFAQKCLQASLVTIELSVPQLNVFLPSHEFLEVMYNRFANDFALWTLRAPAFTASKQTPEVLTTLMPLQPINDYNSRILNPNDRPFMEFASEYKKRKGGKSGASSTSAGDDVEERSKVDSHMFSLQVIAKKCVALMQTQVKHEIKKEDQVTETETFAAQLGLQFDRGQFFIVHGFNKQLGLDKLFVSAEKTYLFHRNLLPSIKPFISNVRDSSFAKYHHADVHAEPGAPRIDVDEDIEDNFALAMQIFNNEKDIQRNIKLAISVRNTSLHYRPVVNPIHYWPQQFANFFDLKDYGVPGYEWPQLIMDLYVQMKNTTFNYDHSIVVPDSPMVLRAIIGNCHFSAGIYDQAEKLSLSCLLDDSRLYLSKRPPKQVQFAEETKSRRNQQQTKTIDVKVGEIGFLHASVEYSLPDASDALPTWDLKMKNDLITLWLCSDTIIELKTLLGEFITSDVGRSILQNAVASQNAADPQPIAELDAIPQIPESVSSAANLQDMVSASNLRTRPSSSSLTSTATATTTNRQLTEEQQDNLKELLSSAMEETAVSSPTAPARKIKPTNPFDEMDKFNVPKSVDQQLGSSLSDDEFVHLDESLGSGITNARGEPKVRIFEEDGFLIIPNHLRQPSEEQTTEMMRFPDEHPRPISTISIEDFSLCVYLFGGSDFVDSRPGEKAYSRWENRRDDQACTREGSEGGPSRDHTVCVQAKVTKISFVRKLFATNAPTLSGSMLTIGDVEVLDRLLASEINKLFYQYVNSNLPRRLNAPLLSICTIEDHCKEGKLKISLLPLRLNVDQDTMEFLGDFFKALAVAAGTIGDEASDDPTSTDLPVMEFRNQHQAPLPVEDQPLGRDPIVTWTKGATTPDSTDDEDGGEDISVLRRNEPPNFDPFDESDIQFEEEEEFGDVKSSDLPQIPLRSEPNRQSRSSLASGGTASSASPQKHRRPSAHSALDEHMAVGTSAASNPPPIRASCSTPSVAESTGTSATSTKHRRTFVQTKETFFKKFTFEPACTIRIDYKPKRLDTQHGFMVGVLKAVFETKGTELTLNEIRNERGILGWNKSVEHMCNEWGPSLYSQLPSAVTSYAPAASLIQIGQGIRDLFLIPMMEMRREDGRLIRGIYRGAASFGNSTFAALIGAAEQTIFFLQGGSEFVYDMVAPDNRRQMALQYHTGRVPGNIREGANMAYDTARSGAFDIARSWQNAAREDRARSATEASGLMSTFLAQRNMARQIIPTVTHFAVIGTTAVGQIASGLKNQWTPDEHQEELNKWRQSASSSQQRQPPHRR